MAKALPSRPDSQPHPQYLLLGEILRPHGIIGEMRMKVLTAYPERLKDIETVYLGRNSDSTNVTAYTIEGARMHQGYALIRFKGINDRSQADLLRQLLVMIPLENAIPLEEGEFYLYQLIGLEVRTDEGEILGQLTEVLETGANDVYIVDSPEYGEVLIPVTPETIIKTDIEAGVVIVKLPEGLIP
jgi:16S rRNA processing protein RimM